MAFCFIIITVIAGALEGSVLRPPIIVIFINIFNVITHFNFLFFVENIKASRAPSVYSMIVLSHDQILTQSNAIKC
jgi:hypothetical protein